MNEDNTLWFYIKHSRDIFQNLIEFHHQTVQDCQMFLVLGGQEDSKKIWHF